MYIKTLFLISLSILFLGCSENPSSSIQTNSDIPQDTPDIPSEAVLLTIGQSNMANWGNGLNYVSSNNVLRINNLYQEVLAISPTTENILSLGTGSNMLPLLGDLLIENDKYSKVIYGNVAVSGSCILEWTPEYQGGHFYKIRDLSYQGYKFTHILFHQGECDSIGWTNTSKADYKARFLSMLNGIRNLGITAPIYLARASYLYGVVDPKIIQAQNELIQENDDIFEGPNTDILGSEYRYDDSHFNEAGLRLHAEMWLNKL